MPAPPAQLEPVTVRKPWGREIWYSGVEARGESRVRRDGRVVPLSRFLADHGRRRPVTLLKALHPDAGNLYLELHEQKSEIYVVDGLDECLWPNGGQMLLGASAGRRAMGEADFRKRLLAAAAAAETSGDLGDVQAFMNAVPLRLGDAVAIEPRVPHSLLRGVSVIEFQTPVFERKILAASQPVVTQQGWDSADAVEMMDLSARPRVTAANGAAQQVLATTPTFTVTRHRLAENAVLATTAWSIAWTVSGEIRCGDARFCARTAWIAPAPVELRAFGKAEVLLAAER